MDCVGEILEYIRRHWSDTVRFRPKDEGTLLGLPRPYTVPCMKDAFQELYYWDTYFACRGLALQNFTEMLRDNCEDFIFEIGRYGFIPNGNRSFYLNRSQPPFFGALIGLVLDTLPDDRELHRRAADALEREMEFWNQERRDRCGLNRYGSSAPDEATLAAFYTGCAAGRVGYPESPASKEARDRAALETLAEAESGWDFTPRFERRCPECAAIDLNSLLFRSFQVLGELHGELGDLDRAAEWFHRAELRRELVERYCWSRTRGAFLDYNCTEKRHVPLLTAASVVPLWCGLATQQQAESTLEAVERSLEYDGGIAACEKNTASARPLQWDFPNAWPPLQFMAIEGFDRYGLTDAARRIAQKYVDCVCRNFRATGDLWEKYNAVTGSADASSGEYPMPAMMGWTAGTFVFAADYLARH